MDLKHPEGWNYITHYMSIGGQCGQSCPCCRSLVGDHLGSCPICNNLKIKQNNKRKNNDLQPTHSKRISLPRKCKKN